MAIINTLRAAAATASLALAGCGVGSQEQTTTPRDSMTTPAPESNHNVALGLGGIALGVAAATGMRMRRLQNASRQFATGVTTLRSATNDAAQRGIDVTAPSHSVDILEGQVSQRRFPLFPDGEFGLYHTDLFGALRLAWKRDDHGWTVDTVEKVHREQIARAEAELQYAIQFSHAQKELADFKLRIGENYKLNGLIAFEEKKFLPLLLAKKLPAINTITSLSVRLMTSAEKSRLDLNQHSAYNNDCYVMAVKTDEGLHEFFFGFENTESKAASPIVIEKDNAGREMAWEVVGFGAERKYYDADPKPGRVTRRAMFVANIRAISGTG